MVQRKPMPKKTVLLALLIPLMLPASDGVAPAFSSDVVGIATSRSLCCRVLMSCIQPICLTEAVLHVTCTMQKSYLMLWCVHNKSVLRNLSTLVGTFQQPFKAHGLCMPLVFVDTSKV